MSPKHRAAWIAASAALSLTASCGRTSPWLGALTLVWVDADGGERRSGQGPGPAGRLDLGAVEGAGATTRVVWVQNDGLGPLEVESVEVVPASAPFEVRWAPATLAPRARQRVELRFAPEPGPAAGFEATLHVGASRCAEPAACARELAVLGQRRERPPDIEATPVLDLGRLVLRGGGVALAERVIEVRNLGGGPLRWTAPWRITSSSSPLDELCIGALDASTSRCPPGPASTPADGAGLGPGQGLVAPLVLAARTPGEKAWAVVLPSNDPDEPEVEVRVVADVVEAPRCDVEVAPAALDFGQLRDTPRELLLALRNHGTDTPCRVSAVRLSGGSDAAFSLVGAAAPVEVPPGGALALTVRAWHPATAASTRRLIGLVEVELEDAAAPRALVPLTATVGPGCLLLQPSALDFGSVQAGCATATRDVTVLNACPGPVEVRGLALTTATSGDFAMTGGPTLPVTLAPAARLTVPVRYHPLDVGDDRSALRVEAAVDGGVLTDVCVLQGRGAPTPDNLDVFQQGRVMADVLLVVDDSCSMSDKQAALAANLEGFLRELQPRGVDFRVGVVTTTMPADGGAPAFVTSPAGHRFLGPGTPALAAEFRSLVSVGVGGDSTESCADPAVAVLEAHPDFLRSGASLSVICVSDEDDQSLQPVHQLWSALTRQRPGVTYNVIGPTPGCAASPAAPTSNGRHEGLVGLTGGLFRSICAPDWGSTMGQLGGAIAGVRASFPLRASPALGSPISVRVDGVDVPAVNAHGVRQWRFEPGAGAVEFAELFTPEYGAIVEVRYQVPCGP